jgi:lipoyl(octanoyl) transferase
MNIEWHWSVPYIETLNLQLTRRQQILGGHTECIVVAEHLPTITLGKRGGTVLSTSPNTVIHRIHRGGLATWHGPGQLALYPIFNLQKRKLGIRNFVCAFEQSIINLLAEYGIEGRRNDSPGIWVGDKKIASLGLDVRKGVNIHGAALNISNAPDVFSSIEACGDSTVEYTSVKTELGSLWPSSKPIIQVGRDWLRHFQEQTSFE